MKRLIPALTFALLSACISKPTQVAKAPAPSGVVGTLPFVLHDNRMLVNVFLNGQGPFVMIFDTGSTNILTPEVQRVLELKSQGPDIDITREATHRSPNTVHLKSFQAGGYTLTDQRFAVVNLNAIRKAFHFSHLDGIVGYELLQQTKVRLDFDNNRILLLDNSAPAFAGMERLQFDMIDGKPVVAGKINDQPAHILIDTGDRSNLTLFRKFAEKTQLENLFANRDKVVTGMGLGGPIPGKVASVQKVDLGGTEVNDVLARLPMTKKGYFYSSAVSASVGIGLLKGFNVEFDYKNRVVALQKRKDFKDSSTFVPVSKTLR